MNYMHVINQTFINQSVSWNARVSNISLLHSWERRYYTMKTQSIIYLLFY